MSLVYALATWPRNRIRCLRKTAVAGPPLAMLSPTQGLILADDDLFDAELDVR